MCDKGYDFAERFHSPVKSQTKEFIFENVRIPTKEEIKDILSPLWKKEVLKSKYNDIFEDLFSNTK